jgi:hypothetical protein
MVAAKMADLKRGRQSDASGSNPPIGGFRAEIKTREESAALLNVSNASIGRAKKVQRDGIPELKDMVTSGDREASFLSSRC